MDVTSTTMSGDIAAALLADEPDVVSLRSAIALRRDCSHEQAARLIRAATLQANISSFPLIDHMELVHTEGCNLACSYCFEKDMLGPRRMPREVGRKAVDLLLAYSGDKATVHISHFGGEPMINFDAVRDITEYALQQASAAGKAVRFDMTSNGVLLTEDNVRYLADRNIMVLLSVDGLAESHDRYRVDRRGRGTFPAVLRALELLKSHQRWVGVKITVMPDLAHKLVENVTGLAEFGVNQFLIGHATGLAWSPEHMADYAAAMQSLKQWYDANRHPRLVIDDLEEDTREPGFFGCQAGRNSISVTIDGEISPCSKILALDNRDILARLGDIEYGLTHLRNRADLVSCGPLREARYPPSPKLYSRRISTTWTV
jgi:uncharacterized protein